MNFSDIFSAYLGGLAPSPRSAASASTSAASAERRADTAADAQAFAAKLRLLDGINDAINEYNKTGDTAALRIYQERMDAAQQAQKDAAAMQRLLVQNKGRMDAAQLKAYTDLKTSLIGAVSRLEASTASQGKSAYQRTVGQAQMQRAQLPYDRTAEGTAVADALLGALDPNDPASYYAIKAWEDTYKLATPGPLAATRDQALAALKKKQEAVTAVENAPLEANLRAGNPLTAAERQQLSDAYASAYGNFTEQPTVEEAQKAASLLQDPAALRAMEAQRAKLMGDLGVDLGVPAGGPPVDKRTEILSAQNFRNWAESRGYELGRMGDLGWVPGKDDNAALAEAKRQMAGGFTFKTGKPKEEPTTFNVQVTKGVQKPEVKPPDAFALLDESVKEGRYTKALAQTGDGRLWLMDLTDPTKNQVVRVPGEGYTKEGMVPEVRALVEKYGDDLEHFSQAGGPSDQPLTFADMNRIASEGNVGQPGVGAENFQLWSPTTPSERSIPETDIEITGHELPPAIQDDPTKTRRLRTAQGDVVLKRESKDAPWVIASGEYNPWRDYRPTKAKEEKPTIGAMLREAAAARRQKRADEQALKEAAAPKPALRGVQPEGPFPSEEMPPPPESPLAALRALRGKFKRTTAQAEA